MFELLILESAQAGLSWIAILHRREQYRAAFAGFDVLRVSRFTGCDIERLMGDSGFVRHRAKICSAIDNAQCFSRVQAEFGNFSDYLWGFVDGAPIVNCRSNAAEVPKTTALSKRISEDMRGRGFRFFGPTICYAYLRSMGLVNHPISAALGAWSTWQFRHPIELSRRALASVFGEQFFSDAHRLWGYFDQFIVFNKL
jgi:DNA-3-methyladenine glycosylase I